MTNKSNQVYQEGADSTALHDGRLYQLDTLFKLTKGRKATLIPIAELTWVLKYSTIDERRVKVADLNAPLLVYDDKKYGLTVIDGVHRLTKALRNRVGSLPVHLLTDTDLKSALVENKDTLSLESKDTPNLKKLGMSVDKKELEEYEEGGKTKVTKESHAIIVPHWVTW